MFILQGFGKADHEVTVALLKDIYDGYDITYSDEGYWCNAINEVVSSRSLNKRNNSISNII